jgi:hypothetical protein
MREFRCFQFAWPRHETGHGLFLGASQETSGTPHISRNDRGAAGVQPSGWENHPGGFSSMTNNQSGQSGQSSGQSSGQPGQQQKRQDQPKSGQQDKSQQQNPGQQNMSGQQNK